MRLQPTSFRPNRSTLSKQSFLTPPLAPSRQGSSVQFGWFSNGHHAVDKGAIFRLPERDLGEISWKKYLENHWLEIEAGNDLQDIIYTGGAHYIDMGVRGNIEPPPDSKTPFLNLDEIKVKLSPQALQGFETEWKTNPLTPESMMGGESVYQSILESYGLVKKQLQQIANGHKQLDTIMIGEEEPQKIETTKAYYKELAHNVGRLAHYVGDAFVPFHVTPNTPNWELYPGSKQGVHLFAEGQVLDKDDYTSLVKQAYEPNTPPVDSIASKDLPTLILDHLKNTFMQVFNIASLQENVLQKKLAPSEIEDELKKAWKPILKTQQLKAQKALASLLHSAWVEAGKPLFQEVP
jgi:hypothetical protein